MDVPATISCTEEMAASLRAVVSIKKSKGFSSISNSVKKDFG